MTTRPKPNRGPDELERRKWYNSTHWRRMRSVHLVQHPFCVDCGAKANVVDHFMGHSDGGWRERFWNPAYFASRCAVCHNKRTMTVDLKLRQQMKKPAQGRLSTMDLAMARLSGKLRV